MKKDFGIIGMGVMGKSLARNFASKGTKLALFNRYAKGTEEQVAEKFIGEFEELNEASGFEDMSGFVNALSTPRKILLMVKAGEVTDSIIEELSTLLEANDIIIDGGNSHYKDTERRIKTLNKKGIHYIGSGISGGEEGALKGPSIMPGGDKESYDLIAPIVEQIAAKDDDNKPCCTYIGKGGSGHFVKMVHNGIEYAEMQLIAEVYSLMRYGLLLEPDEIASILKTWNLGELSSYLLEISSEVIAKKDNENWLIDIILDKAGNKGTGSWTSIAAAELGVSITMINEALFARYISAFKEERVNAEKLYKIKNSSEIFDLNIDQIHDAYKAARIINHHQGVHLISAASQEYNWDLILPEIARVWTNGCIIRSSLMKTLISVLENTDRILTSPQIIPEVLSTLDNLLEVTGIAIFNKHSIPCLAAASNYITAYTSAQSTANIIQGQRDYFGAHTYKRKDDASGKSYHTNWS